LRTARFLVSLVSLVSLMPAMLFADDVFLKGGAKFSGRIVEQTETMVSIDLGDGVVGVALSRIDYIVKAPSALDAFDQKAAKLGPKDAKGWRELGRWAGQEGLSAQSRYAYQKVLVISPDDPEARKALGFVQFDGRWMTEEESYLAQGYVKYDGEWMTPDEAKLLQEDAAAEQARQEAERQAWDEETAKLQAEAQAAKADKQTAWKQSTQNWDFPVYMGGWGYGVTTWPSTGPGNQWLQQWPPKPPSEPPKPPSESPKPPSEPPSEPPKPPSEPPKRTEAATP
jgi:hypothetical protein